MHTRCKAGMAKEVPAGDFELRVSEEDILQRAHMVIQLRPLSDERIRFFYQCAKKLDVLRVECATRLHACLPRWDDLKNDPVAVANFKKDGELVIGYAWYAQKCVGKIYTSFRMAGNIESAKKFAEHVHTYDNIIFKMRELLRQRFPNDQ